MAELADVVTSLDDSWRGLSLTMPLKEVAFDVAETVTDSQTKADAALNRIWRNDEDCRAILLHITDAGLAAIGIEPERPDTGSLMLAVENGNSFSG